MKLEGTVKVFDFIYVSLSITLFPLLYPSSLCLSSFISPPSPSGLFVSFSFLLSLDFFLLFCSSVMTLSSLSLSSLSLSHSFFVKSFFFSHVRNQFSWAVTHTSTAMFSRQMKRGRSDIGHAIAPQATPAWQVIHLLDLITENKGRIPVVPHLLSSLLLRRDGGWICYTCML